MRTQALKSPQVIFVKARWWKVRKADYNVWNETRRNTCALNFRCVFTKPGESTSSLPAQRGVLICWPLHPLSGSLTRATCPGAISVRNHNRSCRNNCRNTAYCGSAAYVSCYCSALPVNCSWLGFLLLGEVYHTFSLSAALLCWMATRHWCLALGHL